ncbi:hypothetical protein [Nocardia sp. NPDC005366]|uniref:hypothetical protein n=1 Tax=Nocardia sp. NPDC005366 TaxID=3156878 RepID=UPI0033B2F22C
MTDFDDIYALVHELNTDWDRTVSSIRNKRTELNPQQFRLPIVDRYDGVEYGTVCIDRNGQLIDIRLDAYEAAASNEGHIITLIIQTVNAALQSHTPGSNTGDNR